MYWRIRKIGPEQIARQYGVHAVLIVSVLFNVMLFTRMSPAKGLTGDQKVDCDRFCRQVTNHLFDANYLTVVDSMNALPTELQPAAIQRFVKLGLIPPTADELRAVARQMDESKSVSCIKFDSVSVGEQQPGKPLQVDCKFQVVVHDSQGVRPSAFAARYYLGTKVDNKTKQAQTVVLDGIVQEANNQQPQS